MKTLLGWVQCLPMLAVCLLGWTADALAHGTAHKMLQDTPSVALEFRYSDGMPMQYAEVLVFSPQDPEIEHQNGRTDKHGRFVFCPDAQGAWLVKVNDGMGHLEQAVVEIGAQTLSGSTQDANAAPPPDGGIPMSQPLKIITGLSLILNVALGAFVLKRRNRGKSEGGPSHEA